MIYDSFPCQTIFSWIWMFSARLDYQTELDCVALRFSQENRLKNMKISCTSWMQTALTFLVWSKYIPIYSKSKVVLKHPSEVGPVMYQNQMWWLAMLAMSQQRQSTVKVVSVELVHLKKHNDCTLCTNKENLREPLQRMCQGFLPKCTPDDSSFFPNRTAKHKVTSS